MKTDQDVRYSVVELCWALGVSRSGFYDHEQKPDGERRREDGVLAQKISVLFLAGRSTYGWRRIQKGLLREGIACGKGRIVRLMRDLELEVIQKRVFRPKTTQSRHDQPIAPNRLKALSEPPQKPNEVWCADITYIPSQQEGWLYLAAVMDLYSRKIVGWATADHLKSSLVKEALARAIAQRGPASGLIHHSDRGIQYACAEYGRLLHCHGMIASMSAQGHCYDNAAMESFFSTLKIELVYRQSWPDRAQATLAIFDYVETFYNRKRLHSSLNYDSPAQFEERALCNN